VRVHGDFILDNILDTGEGFTLIDWRQDFGGERSWGDLYYDLAKLNHSLVFSHTIVDNGGYDLKNVDLLRSDNLCACQKTLAAWCAVKGYDWGKVKVLTALIWMNMAPLHKHPLGEFLYRFGEKRLWQTVEV